MVEPAGTGGKPVRLERDWEPSRLGVLRDADCPGLHLTTLAAKNQAFLYLKLQYAGLSDGQLGACGSFPLKNATTSSTGAAISRCKEGPVYRASLLVSF